MNTLNHNFRDAAANLTGEYIQAGIVKGIYRVRCTDLICSLMQTHPKAEELEIIRRLNNLEAWESICY